MKYLLILICFLLFVNNIMANPRNDAITSQQEAGVARTFCEGKFSNCDVDFQESGQKRLEALTYYDNEPDGPQKDIAEDLWDNGEEERSLGCIIMSQANTHKVSAEQDMSVADFYMTTGEQMWADQFYEDADIWFAAAIVRYNSATGKFGTSSAGFASAEDRFEESVEYYGQVIELLD